MSEILLLLSFFVIGLVFFVFEFIFIFIFVFLFVFLFASRSVLHLCTYVCVCIHLIN